MKYTHPIMLQIYYLLYNITNINITKLLINYTLKFKHNILVSPKKFVSSRN